MSKVHAPEDPEGQGAPEAEAPAAQEVTVTGALADAVLSYREAVLGYIAARDARTEVRERHRIETESVMLKYEQAQMILNAALADLEHVVRGWGMKKHPAEHP